MFIVIEIQTAADGKVATIVNSYASQNDAESKFHSILTAAALSSLPVHSAIIMNEKAEVIRAEHYTHGGAD